MGISLSREPTSSELTNFTTLLKQGTSDDRATPREALEDLFWSVLTSKEFLFNH